MKVRDIMTKQVTTLDANDTVEHAAELMKDYNVGSIPVCNEDEIIGIVTDRDIAIRSVAEGENTERQNVRAIMSSNPVVGNPEMDIHDAAKLMADKQIRRLPIVENNHVVGIVALGDLAVEPKLTDNAGIALERISEPSSPTF